MWFRSKLLALALGIGLVASSSRGQNEYLAEAASYENVISNSSPYSIQAGVARDDITPIKRDRYAPMWLGGFAFRRNYRVDWQDPADPGNELYGNVLAIRETMQNANETKINTNLLVTADILGFPQYLAQGIREDLRKDFGLRDDQIFLNASHDHSGPALPEQLDPYISYGLSPDEEKFLFEYGEWLRNKIRKVAQSAVSDLEPAEMYFGQAPLNYNYNRHGRYPRMSSDMSVMSFKRAGTPVHKAIIVSYAAHPIIMGRYENGLPYMKYHPDYPGVVVRHLERRYPGSTVMFMQGAAGDVNPGMPGSHPLGPFIGFGVQLCDLYGLSLANEAANIIGNSLEKLSGPIKTDYLEAQLPLDLPDLDKLRAAYECVANNADHASPRWRHAKKMLAKVDAGKIPASVQYPIEVWQFEGRKPLALIGLAGEPVQGYGILFRNALGKYRVWTAGYSNELPLYLSSDEMLVEPLYESGWNQEVQSCAPPPRPRSQPTFAGGSMIHYGLPAPLKGRRDGAPSAEQIVVRAVLGILK